MMRYTPVMRCFVFLSVVFGVAPGLAQAQRAPTSDGADTGVTVNMDALTYPEPASSPEPPAVTVQARSARIVPLPRPKPEQKGIAAELPTVPAVEVQPPQMVPAPPVPKPPKADLPASMIENFPVELRGTASDPFANAKPRDPTAGFELVGRIRFAKDASQLPPDGPSALDLLAENLQLSTARVRLAAYSGRAGDMSSNVRRLSLDRARAVRDYLVSRGIAFERIDVMPFGGATSGVSDRVDVLAPPG